MNLVMFTLFKFFSVYSLKIEEPGSLDLTLSSKTVIGIVFSSINGYKSSSSYSKAVNIAD